MGTTSRAAVIALSLIVSVAVGCGGGGGGGGGNQTCAAGQVDCGGTCLDPNSSTSHCGASGTCIGGQAGTACDPGEYCSRGSCVVSCASTEVVCDNTCVNPDSSNAHCGAAGNCLGANAGASCASDHTCTAGSCVCSVAGRVDCGGACIDPMTDEQHCGASSTCSGSAAGKVCGSGQRCLQGACELDWTPTTSLTAVPHFQDGPTTLVHLVYQGGTLVDTTGHTTWASVGAPAQTEVGMWSPAQYYTGPFAVADPQPRWVGTGTTKAFLDANTAGDFLVCARFKPGAHPASEVSKVIIASGRPDTSSGSTADGGWALTQKYMGYYLLYQDVTQLLMVGNGFSGTVNIQDAEWAYFCAGKDGTVIHAFNEGQLQNETGMVTEAWGSASPAGALQTSPDDPTVGSYADGTHPLLDAGVYEIIITADRATSGNALNLIAGASGGVLGDWTSLATFTGADGQPHVGAPSTVPFNGGAIATDHSITWGAVLPSSPAAAGTCYGLVASAADWSTLPGSRVALRWANATGSSQLTWINSTQAGVEDYDAGPPPISGAACANPGPLAAGSHTFLACHGTDGIARAYVDGNQFSESVVLDPTLGPDLDDVASTFTLGPIGSGVTVSRVFACGTANPLVCD